MCLLYVFCVCMCFKFDLKVKNLFSTNHIAPICESRFLSALIGCKFSTEQFARSFDRHMQFEREKTVYIKVTYGSYTWFVNWLVKIRLGALIIAIGGLQDRSSDVNKTKLTKYWIIHDWGWDRSPQNYLRVCHDVVHHLVGVGQMRSFVIGQELLMVRYSSRLLQSHWIKDACWCSSPHTWSRWAPLHAGYLSRSIFRRPG